MMHFFVESVENRGSSPNEFAAALQHRLTSLDYLAGQYQSGNLGFYFRSLDGRTSYELHRATSLPELDARLKSNPQWPYVQTTVTPVTKTSEMIREVTSFLGIEPRAFFLQVLADLRSSRADLTSFVDNATNVLSQNSQDVLALFAEDEEPINEEGLYTLAAKKLSAPRPDAKPAELEEIWRKTLRSQVMHLNSQVEFIDYNPVGVPNGILIGKVPEADLRKHIEATEIFPHTTVEYRALSTPLRSAHSAASTLSQMGGSVPQMQNIRLSL